MAGDPGAESALKSEAELVTEVHENFIASFRKLAEHCPEGEFREKDGVFAFTTGLPLALFNGCVVVRRSSPSALDEALRWVAARGVPYRVWLEESIAPELDSVPLAHALSRNDVPYPGMTLHPIPDPPSPRPDVVVETVLATDPAPLRDLLLQGGMSPELAGRVYPSSLVADTDVRAFVGRLDGRPVASSLAIRSSATSGIYAVGTLPAARRRGVGAAVTWAAIDAGRSWGCRSIVLQASEMGLPLYERMGFRTVVRYIIFNPLPVD